MASDEQRLAQMLPSCSDAGADVFLRGTAAATGMCFLLGLTTAQRVPDAGFVRGDVLPSFRSAVRGAALGGSMCALSLGTFVGVSCSLQHLRGRKFADLPSSMAGGMAAAAPWTVPMKGAVPRMVTVMMGGICGAVYHTVRVMTLRHVIGK